MKLIVTNKKHIKLMNSYNRDYSVGKNIMREAGEIIDDAKNKMVELIKKEYPTVYEQSLNFTYCDRTNTIEWEVRK